MAQAADSQNKILKEYMHGYTYIYCNLDQLVLFKSSYIAAIMHSIYSALLKAPMNICQVAITIKM